MSYVNYMNYVSYMSYVDYLNYVVYMKYISYMSHVIGYLRNVNYICYMNTLWIASSQAKSQWNCFKYNVFNFKKNFEKFFCQYIRKENPNYKHENYERKHLRNMRKDQFL